MNVLTVQREPTAEQRITNPIEPLPAADENLCQRPVNPTQIFWGVSMASAWANAPQNFWVGGCQV